jgi:hypothetical protein
MVIFIYLRHLSGFAQIIRLMDFASDKRLLMSIRGANTDGVRACSLSCLHSGTFFAFTFAYFFHKFVCNFMHMNRFMLNRLVFVAYILSFHI